MLNRLINSELGPWMGVWIARLLPRTQAYAFGRWIARLVARRRNTLLYKSVRSNQAVIRGQDYGAAEMEGVVEAVFEHAAINYVDWLKSFAHGADYVEECLDVEDHIISDAWIAREQGHGVVYAGGHLSNFNLFLLMLGVRKMPVQVLSYHDERGSYRTDNALREQFNLHVTPISMKSLRLAIKRLYKREFVLTGVDRPDTGGVKLNFFGRKVMLPVGHARLAIRTSSYLIIGVVQSIRDGFYRVTGPGIIQPEMTGNDDRDVLRLAQQTIDVLSTYIESRPEEWLMYHPVFPDAMPD